MILDFIFEHIPFLKQLPDFSSCRVFGTYPGFELVLRQLPEFMSISIFKPLRPYVTKVKNKQNRK